MIRAKEHKKSQIIETITHNISDINYTYGNGPDFYFYKRLKELRENTDVIEFIENRYHMEMLYATLVAWDMNSLGAKMKDFNEFRNNILTCNEDFHRLQDCEINMVESRTQMLRIVRSVYARLSLMKTDPKLVSNSKLLHFLFPKILMPMDRKHTLNFFYGNDSECLDKYMEIVEFSQDIMSVDQGWERYIDGEWNTTVPKMIDNAIVLIRRQ